MLLVGSTVPAWAQTAALPPQLDPLIGCSSESTGQSASSFCDLQAAYLAVPGVAAQRFVMPTGLPRAGDGSMAEQAEAR
jgi:hypothetical protein